MTCQGRTNQETKGLVCAIHLNHCKAVWHCRLQVHRTLKLTNLWVYVHILSPILWLQINALSFSTFPNGGKNKDSHGYNTQRTDVWLYFYCN